MLGELADVLGRVEHDVHVAEVDRDPLRAEDRERHAVVPQAVEQEPAQGRVELVEQLDHGLDLPPAGLDRQGAPDPLAAGEALDRLERAADLHVGLGPAAVGQPLLGHLQARLGDLAALLAELEVDDLLGLEQVRQGRRDVADLVARRLGMPAQQALVGRRGGAGGDLQVLADHVGAELPFLAEAEQPVDADLLAGGHGGDGLGARQPQVGGRQQLRERRAVEPQPRREGRAAEPRTRDHLGQVPAEDLDRFPAVHFSIPSRSVLASISLC